MKVGAGQDVLRGTIPAPRAGREARTGVSDRSRPESGGGVGAQRPSRAGPMGPSNPPAPAVLSRTADTLRADVCVPP
ncbi:hypothetical protein DEI84_13765 [Curtobacterium sp. MCBD17_023]|nr:hypothetical protein DEI84_13765 [Curtobacterium sp. MCBD17_023]